MTTFTGARARLLLNGKEIGRVENIELSEVQLEPTDAVAFAVSGAPFQTTFCASVHVFPSEDSVTVYENIEYVRRVVVADEETK